MAAAAAMIDTIGSLHPSRCMKIGKYSASGHTVLRSEKFCFQQQADKDVLRLEVSRPGPRKLARGRRSCRDSLHSGETPRSLQSANITPNQLAVVRTRRCPVSEFFTRPFTPAVSTHEYSLGMAYLINGFSDFFSWRHGFCKGSESYGAFRRIADRRSPSFCPP